MPEDTNLNSKECRNKYEFIMVVAKEARRLNNAFHRRKTEPKERVTIQAIRRAQKDGVEYVFGRFLPEEEEPTAEES